MDKKQLVTIAVTAVVSVIAKELVTWLLAFARIQVLSDRTREKARKAFSQNNRSIMWAVFWFLWVSLGFFRVMRESTPITRWTVVLIIIYFLGIFFWLMNLLWYVIKARGQRD